MFVKEEGPVKSHLDFAGPSSIKYIKCIPNRLQGAVNQSIDF